MEVFVHGDENEIEVKVGGQTYIGDLHEMSEDDDGPEMWQIDGEMLETDSIICRQSLEDLARSFLEAREITFSKLTVTSDSFTE